MRYLLSLLLLITVLISAGCVNGNQNSVVAPTPQIVYITVLVTPTQTTSMTTISTIGSKATEPIIGKWIGSDEKSGMAVYCQFSEEGVMKMMVVDTVFPDATWKKIGEDSPYVNYSIIELDGRRASDFTYFRDGDFILIKSSGFKLYRAGNVQFPNSFPQSSTETGSITIVVRGDQEYNWGEELVFMGTDTNGKTVTLTSTSQNTGETRVLGSVSVAVDKTWVASVPMTSIIEYHYPGVYIIKAQDGSVSDTVPIIIN